MKVIPHSIITADDVRSFHLGNHYRLYQKLGSRLDKVGDTLGCYFSVYAPAAKDVYVSGDFNSWEPYVLRLILRDDHSGIWEGFITDIKKGDKYKYIIVDTENRRHEKADPYGWLHEQPPGNASIVWDLEYSWGDAKWLKNRKKNNSLDAPWSVYEVHLESWKKEIGRDYELLSYRELADQLIPYVKDLGFTHIELMPITEYPYHASWGYQVTGFFAATSRFGSPQDFMHFVDRCHQESIGVILDWVPSHFPSDAHGLAYFDGTPLYEHPDPKKGYHPDWKSMIFNYEKNEIRAFLISSGFFWFDLYHIDGIRVDAVASIIHLDYSRDEGDWDPNVDGGRDNLAGVSFLQELNKEIYEHFPDVQTIAEESTDHPLVTHSPEDGGLGFGMKWMMGWMHDTLDYFKQDPIYRKGVHDKLTFGIWYAFSEKFMLPYSHDEVVHGKSPMIFKMPGELHDKFANLKCLYTLMYTHPGTKLLFMGGEFAQTSEWDHMGQLDWHLLEHDSHRGVQVLIKELNTLYTSEKGLYHYNFDPKGFEWCHNDRWEESVLAYYRHGDKSKDDLLIILNLTPVKRDNYYIDAPANSTWKLIFHTELNMYGGSLEDLPFKKLKSQKYIDKQILAIDLLPLSAIILKKVGRKLT